MFETAKNLTELAKNITETPTVKRTFDNWLYRKTRKFNIESEMMQMEDAEKLKKFHESLQNGFESVPVEYRVEPRRCIADRAYDSSLYYIEEDELINLFENLIVASSDERYLSDSHPAFISIIEQLSPLDARNLMLFKKQDLQPIVDYVYDLKSGYSVFYPDVFLENPEEQNINLQCVSIRNLVRLGLLELPEKQFSRLPDDSVYEKYKQTPLYLSLLSRLNSGQLPPDVIGVKTIDSYVALTALGKSFLKVCVR